MIIRVIVLWKVIFYRCNVTPLRLRTVKVPDNEDKSNNNDDICLEMRSVSLKFNERDEVDTMIVINNNRLNKEPILQGILDSKQL